MNILIPATVVKDIGRLDATLRLPTAPRTGHHMATICCICGQQIEDETFLAGFKLGYPNMILHEACLPEGEPKP